jgi:Sulfite exporter TauE/SafE
LSAQADRLGHAAPRGNAAAFAVGCSSGLLNGAAGIGGPPAVVFYFTAHAAAVGRASLIAYFVFTDINSLAWAGVGGLLHGAAWSLVVVALPFSLLGVWIGSRLYLSMSQADLRRWVWRLLLVLGAVGLVSAAWRLHAPADSKTASASLPADMSSAHSLTGEAGSSSSAIRCCSCVSSRIPAWPKRGMLEHAA